MSYGATQQRQPSQGQNATVPGVSKTKVEPKVNLAAERTLLNTLRVSLLIGSFSIALLNAANRSNHPLINKCLALFYALFSVAGILYGYKMFQLRRERIANKYPGHFDELVGPMVLCVLLFAAVLINFLIQVSNRDQKLPTPKNPWVAAYLSNFISFSSSSPPSTDSPPMDMQQ